MRRLRVLGALSTTLMLSACIIPGNGPLTSQVLRASANDGVSSFAKTQLFFDGVDVDQDVAVIASEFWPVNLQNTFGAGSGSVNPTLGVGDQLEITIFEAGPDGLFSTADRKSSVISIAVQPDGNAAIPYVGSFRFAGKTLEQARGQIASLLAGRAVEPDVILTVVENGSRTVSVSGSVGSPSSVALGLRGERIMEVLAKAGGPSVPPYEAMVTLTRNGIASETSLQTLLSNPSENIYAQPGDQIFVSAHSRTFSVLGSAGRSARIPFETETVNLIEAASLAGGSEISLADSKGYFVFRYEHPRVVEAVLGAPRLAQLKAQGMRADGEGRYPIAYRFDLSDPSAYLVGQKFLMRDGDVLYVARHRSADFIKFVSLLTSSSSVARTVADPVP